MYEYIRVPPPPGCELWFTNVMKLKISLKQPLNLKWICQLFKDEKFY